MNNDMNNMNNVNDNANNEMNNNMNGNVINGIPEIPNMPNNNMNENMNNGMPEAPSVPNVPVNPVIQPETQKSNKGVLYAVIAIVLLAAIGAALYFFVFKGGKEDILTCNMSQSQMGMTLTADVKLKFKDGYFKGGEMSETLDVSAFTDQQFEEIKKQDLCDSLPAGNDYVTYSGCKQTINGKKLTLDVGLKAGEKANTEKLEVSEGKSMFEQMGFTCK